MKTTRKIVCSAIALLSTLSFAGCKMNGCGMGEADGTIKLIVWVSEADHSFAPSAVVNSLA